MNSTEAAKILGMTVANVNYLCSQGKIVATKSEGQANDHGGRWEISEESLKKFKRKPRSRKGRPRKGDR